MLVCQAQKQPSKKDLIPIQNEMAMDNYHKAAEKLCALLKKYPDNGYLNLQHGICLVNINSRIKDAIKPLEKASKHYGLDANLNSYGLEANYHLAQAYHLNYQFQKALQRLEQLKTVVPDKRKNIHRQLDLLIRNCTNAIELKKHPVDFRISNLGQAINSEYNEHSPVISADESLLMFTSNRKGTDRKLYPENMSPEDIYATKWREGKWLPSVEASGEINTLGYDATCSLSPDGKTLIQYQNHGKGDLYISHFENKGWTKPIRLPKPINSLYEESHGSLSLDGNTLIFTSDRPNGVGGTDIYISKKLPDGNWGKAIILGSEINTSLNEESPFLSYDGTTLYFASEGHGSMGGFDIFKSVRDSSGQWSPAQNIGYPINTPGDDLFYFPTYDEQRVYFASERPGGYGRSDIYIIEYPSNHERSLAVVSGYIFTTDGKSSTQSKIIINNQKSGELVGIYRPQVNSGKYTMILPTGINYDMIVKTEGHATIIQSIHIPYRADYKTRTGATFLGPLIIKE